MKVQEYREEKPIHPNAEYATDDGAMPTLEDEISRTDEDMRTPLHYAALKGHSKVVIVLLSAGACIQPQDTYGWTALHAAAHNGHADVVEVLIHWKQRWAPGAYNPRALGVSLGISGHRNDLVQEISEPDRDQAPTERDLANAGPRTDRWK